jgi:NHLM bacteriocin system ABC transporter ATP-binding protein
MLTPQATALLVDHVIPATDYDLLTHLGLGLLAAASGAAIFRYVQGRTTMRVETAADSVTQAAVWDRLLKLRLSFFRRYATGDLQSRVTAVSQIRAYLSGTALGTLFSGVVLLLNLFLLLYYSPALALVALAVAAVSAAVTLTSGALILRYSRTALELQGRFFGLMVQLVNGIAKLRVAAAEERAFATWAAQYARLLGLELRQRRIQDRVQLANIALSALGAIVLFAFAVRLLGDGGGLTTGVFLAFHVAYGTFIGAIVSLSNTVTDVMATAVLRERARPILEATPEVQETRTDPGRLEGRIEMEHVDFRYDAEGPAVLEDVSLVAEPGQFVALVGPSGSGKSTVLRLLLGLESPSAGGITYDGQDLAGIDVHAVRRQIGVVLQDGRINAGSLFDSIAANARITLEDAWEAARATGFADDVTAMPMGMHTIVSEGGTNLSGGQRQRLLLTRALVQRPRMLLLDEATSALDNRTQSVVAESLERLAVTRVVVAHRLSTIRRADRIYVVDRGRIVEQGRFDDLAGAGGLFSRLMARQLG